MKKLPIGIQFFANLREGGFLYVDKTEIIERLISAGTTFFLSRPRRFGKSLLVSTLEEIFKGNKALFEGLAIYDKYDWTQTYPVIRIDWSSFDYDTLDRLKECVAQRFQAVARSYEVSATDYTVNGLLELIEQLHLKTGRPVVVLVDEYDKPMLDAIADDENFEEVKKYLHSFYGILKGAGEHLRFLFLTGVSKFAGVSIFSGLNNINDITVDKKYAALCGYTQEELENNFSEQITTAAEALELDRTDLLERIRFWYNGYSWDGKTRVYNPFSTLMFFDKEKFENFWFSTGTPTFLIEILKSGKQIGSVLRGIVTNDLGSGSYDVKTIREIPLLFQTGYLTIKKQGVNDSLLPEYTLDFPNFEVRNSFLVSLLDSFSQYPNGDTPLLIEKMKRQLIEGDVRGLESVLRGMLAFIPYSVMLDKEAYYHSLMLVWLRLLGCDILGEIVTNKGRIDAVLTLPGHVFVIEVKCQPEGSAEIIGRLLDAAVGQIKEKGYTERFGVTGEGKVSLLGVAFVGKEIACRLELLS
jgi:hypothetical protein